MTVLTVEQLAEAHHVMALYASEADGPVVDQAAEIAARSSARLTIAVPVLGPSTLLYLSPFAIDPVAEDVEREAECNARLALRRVPRQISATAVFIRRGKGADAIDGGTLPVDLVLYRLGSKGRRRRPISSLIRAARRGGISVLAVAGGVN